MERDRPTSPVPGPKIEVTPDMIEAGVEAAIRCGVDSYQMVFSDRDLVVAVYRAMDGARIQASVEMGAQAMHGTVTAIGDTHFHACERCGDIWCHTKALMTPEERERLHRCPKCVAGPYITAYSTKRDANEVSRVVREANAAALTAE